MKVYCDFDGTITQQDVIDLLLERLADSSWQDIETRWIEGEIGSRECLSKQIPLINGGWKAIENLLQEIKLDPSFKSFSKWCERKDIPLFIVSEGLQNAIKSLLNKEDIKVEKIWANKLELSESGKFTLLFPYPSNSKNCNLGLCKCQILEQSTGNELKIVIGDGLNDICWTQKVNLVFAKAKLLKYCELNNIPCIPFENFNEITSTLEKILRGDLTVISGELVKSLAKENINVRRS